MIDALAVAPARDSSRPTPSLASPETAEPFEDLLGQLLLDLAAVTPEQPEHGASGGSSTGPGRSREDAVLTPHASSRLRKADALDEALSVSAMTPVPDSGVLPVVPPVEVAVGPSSPRHMDTTASQEGTPVQEVAGSRVADSPAEPQPRGNAVSTRELLSTAIDRRMARPAALPEDTPRPVSPANASVGEPHAREHVEPSAQTLVMRQHVSSAHADLTGPAESTGHPRTEDAGSPETGKVEDDPLVIVRSVTQSVPADPGLSHQGSDALRAGTGAAEPTVRVHSNLHRKPEGAAVPVSHELSEAASEPVRAAQPGPAAADAAVEQAALAQMIPVDSPGRAAPAVRHGLRDTSRAEFSDVELEVRQGEPHLIRRVIASDAFASLRDATKSDHRSAMRDEPQTAHRRSEGSPFAEGSVTLSIPPDAHGAEHNAAPVASAVRAAPVEVPEILPAVVQPATSVELQVGSDDSQVVIRVQQRDGDVSVRIQPSSSAMHEELSVDAAALVETLTSNEVRLTELELTPNHDQLHGDGQSRQDQPQRRYYRASAAGAFAFPDDLHLSDEALRNR